MVTLKDFIKDNSTTETSKKKRRLKLKNLNPFRNRKYKTLNDDLQNPDFDPNPKISSDGDQNVPPLCSTNEKAGNLAAASKRQLPKELLQSARGRLGLSKVNQDDLYPGKRARKEGSSECLIDTVEAELASGDDVISDPTLTNSDDEENGNVRTKRPSIKRVVISEEIEVIETEVEGELKKKKKSKKKKIKKAGKRAIKYLGHGLTNMAMSLRYLTPDAAIAPALNEIARQREQRYRELSAAMAYTMMT
ncbi:uncharacterized protein [Asterias amurensis]|uniref:uncharacterized protein n=1 Tax=Asterias amurensis TaxID=7602 RepID=UPI003AB1BE2F